MLAWPNFWSDLSGRTCYGEPRITRGAGWSNQVSGSPTTGTMVNIEVKSLQTNCNFTVKVTGMVPTSTTAATPPLLSGLVVGALDNGRNVAIPLSVSYDPVVTCGAPPTCNLLQGSAGAPDAIFDCANASF
jgi:hypothetical protein